MKTFIRKTITGSEYWDTEAKRTLFVPAGKEPDFEVTEYPKSMIMGVDLASGKDMTVVNGQEIDSQSDINLDGMSLEQMLAVAEENGIEVPGNMKKLETIGKYIADALAVDAE